MSSSKTINIAIVGYGNIAKARHLISMQKEGANPSCIIDINITESEIDGIKVFKSLEEARLNNVNIDAVAICTPPNTHANEAIKALKNGYHVLLEKPPVLNLGNLDELEALAKEKGKTLFLAYHTANSPAVYKLQELLRDKNVLKIEGEFLEQVTKYHPDENSWIFDPDKAGGGVTRDVGINAVSAICKTLPNANFRLIDSKLEYDENYSVDTKALIHLEDTVTGTKVTINLDWFNGVENEDIRKIKYTTDSGVYVLDLSTARLFEEIEGEEKEIETERTQEYENLYKEFFYCIEKGDSYTPRIEAELIDNIYSQHKRELESEGKVN